jgi:hypothetical protein
LKILLALASLLKSALFKSTDELNPKSHKFDAVKVSIFAFIVLSSLFNFYALKTLGTQLVTIDNYKKQASKNNKYKECINQVVRTSTQAAITGSVRSSDVIAAVEECGHKREEE